MVDGYLHSYCKNEVRQEHSWHSFMWNRGSSSNSVRESSLSLRIYPFFKKYMGNNYSRTTVDQMALPWRRISEALCSSAQCLPIESHLMQSKCSSPLLPYGPWAYHSHFQNPFSEYCSHLACFLILCLFKWAFPNEAFLSIFKIIFSLLPVLHSLLWFIFIVFTLITLFIYQLPE